MIVEDEPIERQGIRLMLENNVSGLSAICEAADGMEAIELFRSFRPHIVLVDIHMPGINGLQTIDAIRKIDSAARFIILTSHEKFEYAHEAIKLGVDDYLLKPARIAKLKESVQSVIDRLAHDQAENSQKTALLDRMNSIRPILERDLIYELIRDMGAPMRTEDFRFLDFEVSGGFCFVLQCGEEKSHCLQRVKQVFQQLGVHCIGEEVNGRLVFFVLFGVPRPDTDPAKMVAYILEQLKVEKGSGAVRAGVSGASEGIQPMRRTYPEALAALEEAARSGDALRRFESGVPRRAENAEQVLQELRLALAARDVFQQKVAGIAQQALQRGDLLAAREEMAGILTSFRAWMSEVAGAPAVDAMASPFDSLRTDDAKALSAAFEQNMLNLAQSHWRSGEPYSNALIGRVLKYIDENYMKNLSLDSIADYFHITPFYLSRMINNKVGKNFPDILAERRIREAKVLLRRGVSIKEATYEVGFSSQNYFGKTFKRLTGMTPSEYRAHYHFE
jgi:two-component system response regulator YesN